MLKAIFYEGEGGWLHKCAFAGLDNEGKPQWIMMDRGEHVVTQDVYMQNLFLGRLDFLLLCEEGEVVKSLDIAKLMAASLSLTPEHLDKQFEYQIASLKEMGVAWSHKPLTLVFSVLWSNDAGYSLEINACGGAYEDFIIYKDKIASLSEVMDYIKAYQIGLSEFADIKSSAELVISSDNYPKLSNSEVNLFTHIEQL